MAQLDLAFCCDCTGSMGSYIRSAQDNIRNIAESIGQKADASVSIKYALVKYRDHPPQDSTFVTEVFPFNGSLEVMKKAVDTMRASGGGDGPEAVAAALHEVNELEWRPNATKVVVLISDAPPHGLGEDGDGFPNGCPLGHDPIVTAKDMAGKGIIIYSVGVEPILSTSYKFARDFMMSLAQITQGKFVPLGKAEILADVVVSGALEGVNMDETWAKVEAEIAAAAEAKGDKLDDDDLVERVEHKMKNAMASHQMQQVEVSNPYMSGYNNANCDMMFAATSLAGAREQLDPSINANVGKVSAETKWAAQVAETRCDEWTYEQQSRCVQRGKTKKGM